jgi:hypothetical protein
MFLDETRKTELKIFDINTSYHDIMTRISVFNPYPEKSKEGFWISRFQHPTSDPKIWIKYPSTDEVFYVSLPLHHQHEVTKMERVGEEIVPCDDDPNDRWISLQEFMPTLSRSFVQNEFFNKADGFDRAIERTVVKEYRAKEPVFYETQEAYIRIIREAFSLLEQGDFYTAWRFVDDACRTGAYNIAGNHYSQPASAMFKYICRELAWKVCPALLEDHLYEVYNRGKWTIVNDTAHEVQGLLIAETRRCAFDQTLSYYSSTALEHLNVESTRNLNVKNEFIEKLMQKESSRGETYYSQAMRFFVAHQIYL